MNIGDYVVATLGTLMLGGTILMIIQSGSNPPEYCILVCGGTIRTTNVVKANLPK